MDVFLVNQDNPHAQSLCKKLAEAKDGEFVPLSTEEFYLRDSEDFQHINYSNSESSNIVEVDKDKSYIFVCKPETNIDDVVRTIKDLGLDAGIVRSR